MMYLKKLVCAAVFASLVYIALSAETTLYDALSKDPELSDVSINILILIFF